MHNRISLRRIKANSRNRMVGVDLQHFVPLFSSFVGSAEGIEQHSGVEERVHICR
jgi:hypothetical protein